MLRIFTLPFQLGELLEAAALVLILFIVGSIVWLLVNLLQQREQELKERLEDLERTRAQLIEGERWLPLADWRAPWRTIGNLFAIIPNAIAAAVFAAFSTADREEMRTSL